MFFISLQLELTAVFSPQLEKAVNYSVICKVRSKPTPLVLNVKGEGYALHNTLLQELPDGSTLELSKMGINDLDFGQVRGIP
jgi:hydrocephalus-inducing protein